MKSDSLEGRVALITGSSRGIGQAIAERLSAAGASVVINSHESAEAADAVAAELPGDAIAVQADVTSASDVDALLTAVKDRFGRLDILVNNAGKIYRPGEWDSSDLDVWRMTVDSNLGSTFIVTRAFVKLLQDSGRGRIINIASTYGQTGAAPVAAYTAAKAGVINLTLGLAKQLAPTVTVNAVSPGNIDTEMTRSAGPDVIDWVIGETPLGRLGTPDEVAGAVEFLASDSGAFITGHVLVVDGGFMLS